MKIDLSLAGILAFMHAGILLHAQSIDVSPPEKITAGVSKVEVLGKNNQGILVRHVERDNEEVECFYDNMGLRWKKTVPHVEKNSVMEEVITYPDSVLFFYSIISKGNTLLKAYKTNERLESPGRIVICDTLAKTQLNPIPHANFSLSPDKRYILVWFEDKYFDDNQLVHVTCLNNSLQKVWNRQIKITGFEHAAVVTATVDTFSNACIISGDYKSRNFNNDFPYSALLISSVKNHGVKVHHTMIHEQESYYSACIAKSDVHSDDVVIAGLFAHDPGTESEGIYFFRFDPKLDSVITNHYEGYSGDFITQLTGNTTIKRNDGFYDFLPLELIVKRDGGAIFISESQSVTSESFSNSPLGGYGLSSGFTVNYYHYDELAVMSFKADGMLEWKQILHKKQASEGDGGFYSSASTMITPSQLYVVYNDVENGQTTVSNFSLDATGKQQRNEMFSADRKGVNVVPRQAKQISSNEMVLPSFKKNYLQFLKLTFKNQ